MSHKSCFNCGRPEVDVPLVTLQFDERQIYICPQCLPALIHHPENVAEKLSKS